MTTVHPFMVALPAIGLLWCIILVYVAVRELLYWRRLCKILSVASWEPPPFPALMLGMLLTALVAAALCVSAINWILAFT